MIKSLARAVFVAGLMLTASGVAQAAQDLKPFVLAYETTGDISQAADQVKTKLKNAGFDIAGSYKPYDGALVIAVTDKTLKSAAASTDNGGYIAGQRVTLTKVNGQIQVAYTNPVYYGNAYRITDEQDLNKAFDQLKSTLGFKEAYGTGDDKLTAKDLRKYHYMFGMEYFDDPSHLAEYGSHDEAVKAVEKGLAAGKGGAHKVYEISIPNTDQTVFGVGLTQGCSGDKYIMSRVDKAKIRSTGHLPYEVLVKGKNVYALYARFRIAISWPNLPMIQSSTGATFFNIMCAPNAIEKALTEAAGGQA